MGLFDWFRGKNSWEVDEDPNLGTDRQLAASTGGPAKAASQPAKPDAKPLRATSAKPQPKAKAAPTPEPIEDDMPDFGIQKAIELMRDLPTKDSDAVVQAVCKTLESIGVEVPDIIKQAKDKQSTITDRIKNLKGEIADLEEEIAGRKEEIKALEADHKETGDVRHRLEKASKPHPSPSVGDAAGTADKSAAGQATKPGESNGATPKSADASTDKGNAPKPSSGSVTVPKPSLGAPPSSVKPPN